MTINSINREEFDSLNPARNTIVQMITTETAWFSDNDANIIGTVILDKVDNDWGNVVLAKHEDGSYRYIEGQVSLSSSEEAVKDLVSVMSTIESSGEAPEKLFESEETKSEGTNGSILVTDINLELKEVLEHIAVNYRDGETLIEKIQMNKRKIEGSHVYSGIDLELPPQ